MTTAVERATVTTITENYIDILLSDEPTVARAGLLHHFDPRRKPIRAENGISFLVETERRGQRRSVLFDSGLSAAVLLNNLSALGHHPETLSAIVLSHGHPDHHGGLIGLLEARENPMPVLLHPLAFAPRYARLPTGEMLPPHYNLGLSPERIEAAGGVTTTHRNAIEIIDGVFATGPIDRRTAFEESGGQGLLDPGLFQVIDGELRADTVPDDQALVINVDKLGLVVLTGCSHAGVINSIQMARKVTGVDVVHAVMGGFHLGFPGTPDHKTESTLEAMRDIAPAMVAPMHCTGFRAMMRFAQAMPDAFLLNVAGTRVSFGSSR